MDGELRDLLLLAGCGARGEAFEKTIDCKRVLQRAAALEVFPCCVHAIQKNKKPEDSFADLEAWRAEVRRLAMGQAVGREKLFGLLAELQKAGFTYAVIKGCAVAESYGEPFLRLSADTDILIDPAQERDLYHWLERQGFVLERRESQEYHGVARHKDYGILEIHIALSDYRIADYWEKKAGMEISRTMRRPPVWIEGRQGSFYSLDHTEQMIFLTLHFVRHLFTMEGNLRMFLDNCTYASYYREKIDWMFYWQTLERLGYGKLAETIFEAADSYMGFQLAGQRGVIPGGQGKIEDPTGTKGNEDSFSTEKDMEGFLEILCAPQENMRIADRFRDLYRSREMNLGENVFGYRIKALWGVALYTMKHIKKDGLLSVLKRAPGKAGRLLTGKASRPGSIREAQWMEHCREIYGKLGLMRDA